VLCTLHLMTLTTLSALHGVAVSLPLPPFDRAYVLEEIAPAFPPAAPLQAWFVEPLIVDWLVPAFRGGMRNAASPASTT
jgi:hypothetical protein